MRRMKLLAVLVAAGTLMAACGDDDDESTAAAGDGTTTTAAAADETTTTAADAGGDDYRGGESGATVAVATSDALGEYLVGPDGRTLYLFDKDQGTTTACTGGCVDNWPPLVADGTPTAGDGVDEAELATADGIEPNHVTYHGHLLYYFAGDEAPGDTNGTSVPSWFAVSPDGEAITPT